MSWTDERIEHLKNLWQEGLTASQIASRLGGVTRNAVIGKIYRLGLSGRGKSNSVKKAVKKKTMPSVTKENTVSKTSEEEVPQHAAPPKTKEVPKVKQAKQVRDTPVTVLDLSAHMCKWPLGDPTHEGFRFCGKRSSPESPYCTHHSQIAYQAPPKRRRRDEEVLEVRHMLKAKTA